MKRSPIRVDPAKVRAWQRRTAQPLRQRSAKRQRLYEEQRIPFVVAQLERVPWCEAGLAGCSREATTVNERIRRSHGGAIVPGGKGRENEYDSLCVNCHRWITEHPREARAQGWEVQ